MGSALLACGDGGFVVSWSDCEILFRSRSFSDSDVNDYDVVDLLLVNLRML